MIIVYRTWIFGTKYLVAGDWTYHSSELLKGFGGIPQIWDGSVAFGSIDVLPSFDLFKFLYSVLTQFVSFGISERILYFWPILIFAYIGLLKLGKLLFGDNSQAKLIFSLFFLFNTYVLSTETSYITYAAVYALTPLIFYQFMKLLRTESSFRGVVSTSLLLALAWCYEPRGVIALSYLLLLYLLYALYIDPPSWKVIVLKYVTVYGIVSLLSCYSIVWLFFANLGKAAPSSLHLFAAFNSLLDSLGYHNYAWQGNPFENFSLVPFHPLVPAFYFYLVTIAIFSIGPFYREGRSPKFLQFLILSSLVGVFLLKQQNSPFGGLYDWAFHHIPSFNVFRESNKFVVWLLPSSILLGFSVEYFSSQIRSWLVRAAISFAVAALILINVVPVVNGGIGTLFQNRSMPVGYRHLNSFMDSQQGFFRVLGVPVPSGWESYGQLHPELSAAGLVRSSAGKVLLGQKPPQSISLGNQIFASIKSTYAHQFLDAASVKYVVVPSLSNPGGSDLFDNYGGSRRAFVKVLNAIPWLHRIDGGFEGLTVYVNSNFKPLVSPLATPDSLLAFTNRNITFAGMRSPGSVSLMSNGVTQKIVDIRKIRAPFLLSFSESFSRNWKLEFLPITGSVGSTSRPLSASAPTELNGFENGWYLNPAVFVKTLPSNFYKINSDGSFDINAMIYFVPQSTFNITLEISAFSFLVLMCFLIYLKRVDVRGLRSATLLH